MSCLFFAHQLSLFLIHVPPVYRLHENFDARAGYRVKVEDMYTDYMHNFCSLALLEPKKRAEFGKIVRLAFPQVKKRRLGPAGSQESYYVGVTYKASVVVEATRSSPPIVDWTSIDGPQGTQDPWSFLRCGLHGLESVILRDRSTGVGSATTSTTTTTTASMIIPASSSLSNGHLRVVGGGYQTKQEGHPPTPRLEDWLMDFPSYAGFFSNILMDGKANK